MSMKKKWFVLAPLALAGVALFAALGGLIVRELWNWLVPQLLGLPRVTFWEALGILALSRILFGGFGGGPGARARHRLSREEKEGFRRRMREKLGLGPEPAEDERP